MKLFLVLWGLTSASIGLLVFANSKGAVHEIEAGIAFLIMTICVGFLGVIEAIESLTETRANPES